MAVEYVCIIRTESAMQMVHYVYQVYAYRLQVSDDPFYHRALHLDIACQECLIYITLTCLATAILVQTISRGSIIHVSQ